MEEVRLKCQDLVHPGKEKKVELFIGEICIALKDEDKGINTLARCNVVLIMSVFVIPLMLPNGSSSFVNKRTRLSAVFADLRR